MCGTGVWAQISPRSSATGSNYSRVGLTLPCSVLQGKKQEQQSSLFPLASFHINHYFHLAHKIVFILMFSYVCIIVLCSYLPLQSPFLSLLRQPPSTAPFWFFILSRFFHLVLLTLPLISFFSPHSPPHFYTVYVWPQSSFHICVKNSMYTEFDLFFLAWWSHFICFPESDIILFFMAQYNYIIYVYHSLFMHSSVMGI